ncbi:30S ribosomal protein S15, partial [bacterium]|nr:30S ribosomal protein S15 [bacterium]
NIIKKFQSGKKDSGSVEVQVAILSEEIKKLLNHLKKHPKDLHSKRGLLKMVTKRKKLLRYLQRKSTRRYNSLIKKLGLKK